MARPAATPARAKGTIGDLEIVTTGDRADLDEQARDAFRAGWPEFIFHDPISSEHIGRVETYFPQYDVLLLDEGQVVAGGWGVPAPVASMELIRRRGGGRLELPPPAPATRLVRAAAVPWPGADRRSSAR